MNIKARKHMSKGVMRVMRTSPFYSTIILRHNMVEDENVNGMCIDGQEIRYSPEGVLTQTPAELAEYLKHMAMHIAFKHHVRAGELAPRAKQACKAAGVSFEQIFDQSADLSINSLLRKENEFVWRSEEFKDAPMPGIGKFEEFEDGEAVEKYFPQVLKLAEEEEGQQKPGENPPPCNGGKGDSQGNEESEGEGDGEGDGQNDGNGNQAGGNEQKKDQPMNFGQVKAANDPQKSDDEADEIIAAATMAAKSAGEGTGSVNSIIAENEKPVKVDWRAEASQFFERACRGRKNYKHVNRRLWDRQIIFPTNKDKSAKKVIFLVDVSGSMSDDAVCAVYNHIEEVIAAKPKLTVELVPFDDDVFKDHITEYTRDTLPIRNDARSRMGWGGTRFVPAAKYAEDKGREEDISGVVMLTDRMPCDTKDFEDFKAELPWLILSVYEFQFGNSRYGNCLPKWCKTIEIEP